ncbi:MAG: DUF2520 domain-containing protein [Chitinophagales bacterium]|nr:DUF2520 domain-containing protein [Chitinophagales bacterium]
MEIKDVIIIGTGNVAWHLAKAFTEAGISVKQIVGRNVEKVNEIAALVHTDATDDFSAIKNIDGIYLICVKDSAIEDVAKKVYNPGRKLVHCAGGVDSEVLHMGDDDFGVLYPIHPFTKYVEIDYDAAPVCVYGSSVAFNSALVKLAKKLSKHVYEVDDKQRLILNMCAVWVNNFTNHLFVIADEILEKNNLQLEMLYPLIAETVEKIKKTSPANAQTGPAARRESAVLNKHMELLKEHPDYVEIYRLLSASIQNKSR